MPIDTDFVDDDEFAAIEAAMMAAAAARASASASASASSSSYSAGASRQSDSQNNLGSAASRPVANQQWTNQQRPAPAGPSHQQNQGVQHESQQQPQQQHRYNHQTHQQNYAQAPHQPMPNHHRHTHQSIEQQQQQQQRQQQQRQQPPAPQQDMHQQHQHQQNPSSSTAGVNAPPPKAQATAQPEQHKQHPQEWPSGPMDKYMVKGPSGARAPSQQQNSQQQQPQQLSASEVLPPPVPSSSGAPRLTVVFRLIQNRRVSATFAYHPQVIETLKSLSGRAYDPQAKEWNFPVELHNEAVKKLHAIPGVEAKPLPTAVIKALSAESAAPPSSQSPQKDVAESMKRLPEHLANALMPFQQEGVAFAVKHGGRALIGDEMGLGKTIQAISIAKIYEKEWPLLVITPSSLRLVWRDELLKWLPDLRESDITVVLTGKDRIGPNITVISYEFVTKMSEEIGRKNYKIVVADESHYLKNGQAKRTKAVLPVIRKAKRVILLTGTPALSRPAELYTQISSLQPKQFPTWQEFGTRYCDLKQGRWGMEANGATNLGELNCLLQEVMIRRLKADVLTQLPSKRRQQIYIQISSKGMRELRSRMDEMQAYHDISNNPRAGMQERDEAKNKGQVLMNECYKKTGIEKVDAAGEYIATLIEGGLKFLVFGHHQEVLDGLEAAVIKACGKGSRHIRIDGSTGMQDRQDMVRSFQNDQNVQVAVLSITAAGTGLTFTAASAVVFAELHWTPGVMQQAEDRAHRIGQQYSVNIHFLCARGSADDIVWPALEKKLSVLGSALDGSTGGGKLTDGAPITGPALDEGTPSVLQFFGAGAGNKGAAGDGQMKISSFLPAGGGGGEGGGGEIQGGGGYEHFDCEAGEFRGGGGVNREGMRGGACDERAREQEIDLVGASGGATGSGGASGGATGSVPKPRKRQRVFTVDSDED